jgi:hypothetical protein
MWNSIPGDWPILGARLVGDWGMFFSSEKKFNAKTQRGKDAEKNNRSVPFYSWC